MANVLSLTAQDYTSLLSYYSYQNYNIIVINYIIVIIIVIIVIVINYIYNTSTYLACVLMIHTLVSASNLCLDFIVHNLAFEYTSNKTSAVDYKIIVSKTSKYYFLANSNTMHAH